MAPVSERRLRSVLSQGTCGAFKLLRHLPLIAARSANHRAMVRTLREEVRHLLICQLRPVREFSFFPICSFRARGALEHSR
eukprot:1152776-Pyramimonas_sp.AAC.1